MRLARFAREDPRIRRFAPCDQRFREKTTVLQSTQGGDPGTTYALWPRTGTSGKIVSRRYVPAGMKRRLVTAGMAILMVYLNFIKNLNFLLLFLITCVKLDFLITLLFTTFSPFRFSSDNAIYSTF